MKGKKKIKWINNPGASQAPVNWWIIESHGSDGNKPKMFGLEAVIKFGIPGHAILKCRQSASGFLRSGVCFALWDSTLYLVSTLPPHKLKNTYLTKLYVYFL